MNRILSSSLLLLLAVVLIGCPRGAAAQKVAPYIDMSITADENIVTIASSSGLKAFTLAFLDADGGCNIGWGGLGGTLPTDEVADGTSILTLVQDLEAAGVTVIFSIGGANGVDPAAYCTSASSLQAVYQTAVTRYGITYLDFDIEGAATDETAQITLRDQALVGLKSANPNLVISYTIPVLPTGLVANDGLNLLSSAKSDGVALSVVNIMTMDYGSSGTEMGSAATEAAADTEAQIKAAGLSSTVGITPMIGQNDTSGEIFTLADATTVVDFAEANSYVTRLAYWSVGRDNGSCAGDTSASPSCSGISQSTYQFAGIFEGFGGTSASCTTKPSAPTGLSASGTSSTGTTLSWTAVTAPANCTITSYTILKNGSSIGTATGTSFAVTGLSASTTYSFTVEATDADGASAASSALSVTTSAASSCTTKPSAPTGLSASGTTSTGTTLSWTADTAPTNCSISSYTVLKNGSSIGTATGTSFAVSGLSASTTYSFTVEATDADGASAASSALSVTTKAASGSGSLTLSPSSYNFGSAVPDTGTAWVTFTLTNGGSSSVSISSVTVSGPFVVASNCGSSVAADSSCPIYVYFYPTAAGSFTGTLTVNDGASNSPQTSALSGTGS